MPKNNKREIVINADWGWFNLSEKCILKYAELKGIKIYKGKSFFAEYWKVPPSKRVKYVNDKWWFGLSEKRRASLEKQYEAQTVNSHNIPRDDPALIQAIKQIGLKESADRCCKLKIIKIPQNIKWKIENDSGREWIAEQHRTWGKSK